MDEFVTRGEYEERQKSLDAENTRQNHRIEKLENIMDTINELTASVQLLAVRMEAMQKEMEKQGKRLEVIEQEPADKWKSLTRTIITGVVSALVAYFLAKGGIL